MAQIHVVTGSRSCGAKTVQGGNSTVFAGDKLWAVEGDQNDHGGGGLIASGAPTVMIADKRVIVKGDHAMPDSAGHSDPSAIDGSVPSVEAGA